MPVACSTSALTGQEGSIYFKPAGTKFCLLDNTDFPAGSPAVITVPSQHDYKVGDAVKFTEAGRVAIDVSVERGDDDVAWFTFAVSDTGIGIGADKLATIFDAFSQADTSTTREFGGTGLGLAICAQLSELMGGA